jgi:hypothetical protein
MKTIFILALLLFSYYAIGQRPGDEKVINWTVANKDTCWTLDDIGRKQSVALQVVADLANGYFKLFGKSGKATEWFQYGSGSFTQGMDSINVATLRSRNLTSSGWAYDTPIFNNWKVCFYVVTDTVGTVSLYETITKE